MSELPDEKLDELERLAEAFAEDEWAVEGPIVIDTDREFIASCADTTVPAELCGYLAAYIAAADPPTVLALVREVRRLRETLTRPPQTGSGVTIEPDASRHEELLRWLRRR